MIGKNQNFDEPNYAGTPTSRINLIKSLAHFQITDLNHDNPMLKLSNNSVTAGNSSETGESINNMNVIDGKIYETQWKTLVGTDLIYDDYGELIGKVNEHLTCNELVRLQPKETEKDEEDDEETPEIAEGDDENNEQSNFLKKAIKIAKKKKQETEEKRE